MASLINYYSPPVIKEVNMQLKYLLILATGIWGSVTTALFGVWSGWLTLLCCAMAADYLTGVIVAGVFKKSNKTDSGKLESRAGWKGLLRKAVIIILVLLAHRLDVAVDTNYVKDGVCIGFALNELLSILENVGLMGVKIPRVLITALDALKSKIGGDDVD